MRAPGLITAVEGCAQPSDTGGTLDRCELHYAALEIETKCRFIDSSTLDAITKTRFEGVKAALKSVDKRRLDEYAARTRSALE